MEIEASEPGTGGAPVRARTVEDRVPTGSAGPPTDGLRGRWLLAARAAWVAVAVVTLGAFVAAVPVRYAELARPSEGASAALQEIGLSPAGYALYNVALDVALRVRLRRRRSS